MRPAHEGLCQSGCHQESDPCPKDPIVGGGELRVLAGPIYAHMVHFPVTSECCIGQRPKLLMSMTEGLKRHH